MNISMITGLAVLAIYVSDLEKAKHFYIDTLGCTQQEDMSCGVLLRSGELTLYLEGQHTPADKQVSMTHIAPTFDVPSVKAAFMQLKAHNATIIEEYKEHGENFAMFRIADPDGNILEFAGKP